MKETPPSPTDIALRLRSAREQSGLSQGQTAKLLGFQRPTISEIEAGRRKVSSVEVTQFAEIYGVSAAWLLDSETESPDPVLELAARELAKVKKEDLNTVLEFLRTLSKADSRDGGKRTK